MAEAQPLRGLSEQEADRRLALFGPNLVSEPRFRSVLTIARETLREPMFLLLVAAAALYLVVGDLADGIFLSIGALLSLSLVIIQEARSERALRALNALAEPKAQMIRDGRVQAIPAKLLVPGDLVVVAEGGRIPADALLIEGQVLEVDESILTGEAAASTKVPAPAVRRQVSRRPATTGRPFCSQAPSLCAAMELPRWLVPARKPKPVVSAWLCACSLRNPRCCSAISGG